MLRLLLLLTTLLIISQFPCHASDYTPSDAPIELAAAGQQTTELQQQSDHQKRLSQEKKDREAEKQVAAVGAVRTESRGLDIFVMVMLVVSASALFMVSRIFSNRRRKRRRPRRLPAR